jgi:succinate dehydrogenase/fumarate reductase cytochrome b subunit
MKKHPLDISIYILSRVVGVFLLVFCFLNIYLEIHAEDLLEQAFAPAKTYNTVTNLGNTKNAVGNEVFRTATTTQDGLIPGQ